MSKTNESRAVLIANRRVGTDAGEGLTPEEASQRIAYALAMHRHSSQGKLARYEAPLAQPSPPAPPRAVPWAEPEEVALREVDHELDLECAAIGAKLEALRPGSVRAWGRLLLYDFTGARELEMRWHAALDAAQERALARQPPLPVKEGDFVDIAGCALRVAGIDRKRRSGSLEALDASGKLVASTNGILLDGLTPFAGNPKSARPFPSPPDTFTDGSDRARFRKSALKQLLAEAGVRGNGSLFAMNIGYSD